MTPAPTEQRLGQPEDRGGKAQPMLTAIGLRRYFPIRGGILNRRVAEVKAVDDISFTVLKGETLGVVGESGCGKSTLARLLMHLLVRDAGEVIFDGDPVGTDTGLTLRQLRRNLQMVFQDSYSSLNPRLPIEDSIAYAPRVHGMSRTDAIRRAHELLESVGLRPNQFASRYPHDLSGGQKQRVNIARALAPGPRMLILDEAVSALDKSVAAQVLNLLGHLKKTFNLTYMFISHDLHVVQYISDRVMVMYLGQVVELGPVAAVYGAPRHPYTAALLTRPTASRLRHWSAIRQTRSIHRPAADSEPAAATPRQSASSRCRAWVPGTATGPPTWSPATCPTRVPDTARRSPPMHYTPWCCTDGCGLVPPLG
jgi:peptide/nickel transport system ATP-binding protein